MIAAQARPAMRLSVGQLTNIRSMQRSARPLVSDLTQEFVAREQVSVPISSINTPKSSFNRLQSSIELRPNEVVPLVNVAIVVTPDFPVVSIIATCSFTGVASSDSVRQLAERTSREAVIAVASAQADPGIRACAGILYCAGVPAFDAASAKLLLATQYAIAANNIGIQLVLQDNDRTLSTTRSAAAVQKSANATILFRGTLPPGRHVFTLIGESDGFVGVDSGGASIYVQQSAT